MHIKGLLGSAPNAREAALLRSDTYALAHISPSKGAERGVSERLHRTGLGLKYCRGLVGVGVWDSRRRVSSLRFRIFAP